MWRASRLDSGFHSSIFYHPSKASRCIAMHIFSKFMMAHRRFYHSIFFGWSFSKYFSFYFFYTLKKHPDSDAWRYASPRKRKGIPSLIQELLPPSMTRRRVTFSSPKLLIKLGASSIGESFKSQPLRCLA